MTEVSVSTLKAIEMVRESAEGIAGRAGSKEVRGTPDPQGRPVMQST